jgi:hypothetical protein
LKEIIKAANPFVKEIRFYSMNHFIYRKFKIARFYAISIILCFVCTELFAHTQKNKMVNSNTDTALIKLSQDFLYHVKIKEPTDSIEMLLAGIDYNRLTNGLPTDAEKKTFWLNMYNGWFQLLAGREKLTNPEIFKVRRITIAGEKFSLDGIEHGILRKYRWKYSKGYFATAFPGKTIKKLAVNEIDYRIHFALNCGAKSCPPIAFYSHEKIEKQLDIAEKNYLKTDTEVDETNNTLKVTKLMSWFAADFGGKKGVRKIIGKLWNKDFSGYKILYKDYDWEQLLYYFTE